MKRFVAMLLVLTMVLALAGTAMAAAGAPKYVQLVKDSPAYTAARNSKKTKNVALAGSVAQLVGECKGFVKVVVNASSGKTVYFKKCNVVPVKADGIMVWWAKGGKGMSTCTKNNVFVKSLSNKMIMVTGHTNLRKNPGMKFKSQGVVEACDVLKMTGWVGHDDRPWIWLQVCKGGRKLWLSTKFAALTNAQWLAIDNAYAKYYNVETEDE